MGLTIYVLIAGLVVIQLAQAFTLRAHRKHLNAHDRHMEAVDYHLDALEADGCVDLEEMRRKKGANNERNR